MTLYGREEINMKLIEQEHLDIEEVQLMRKAWK